MNSNRDLLLEVDNLQKYFPVTEGLFHRKTGDIKAVDGISFKIYKGETLGLVGESGCGKSTVARSILRAYKVTSGKIFYQGQDLTDLNDSKLRVLRPKMQMIFQDPYSSLNPRMPIKKIIGEPLLEHSSISKKERQSRVDELLDLVGLNSACGNRYPHEFSGGQCQRIGIARALALNPEFVICDEPIAALDVSIQAQVVNLLEDLQKQLSLTYLFISHDLSMIRHISQRVAVMYLGKIMEMGNQQDIYESPLHPYTKALLSAVPIPDPLREAKREKIILKGDVPSPANPPQGCRFNSRCPVAEERCFQQIPEWREIKPNHWTACHLA
ncbi:MAG: dipeptide ABC transporter ATP-binding protein [Anaerolineales bacterium]